MSKFTQLISAYPIRERVGQGSVFDKYSKFIDIF